MPTFWYLNSFSLRPEIIYCDDSKATVYFVKTYGMLAGKHEKNRIHDYFCDVSHCDEVEGLWKTASEKFYRVELWINNAGNGNAQAPTWNYFRELIRKVVGASVIRAFFRMNIVGHDTSYLTI